MGGLFSKPKSPPPPPKPAPIPDEEALQKGRKKSLAAQKKRTGRASTILRDEETLG